MSKRPLVFMLPFTIVGGCTSLLGDYVVDTADANPANEHLDGATDVSRPSAEANGDASGEHPVLPGADDGSGADAAVLDDATDARVASCDPHKPFGVPAEALDGVFASSADDVAVWFSPDELTAYLTSSRPYDAGSPTYNIFSGTRLSTSLPFATMAPVASLDSTTIPGVGSYAPVVTSDGLTVYFTRGDVGTYDTWIAMRSSTVADWMSPQLVAAPLNVNGGGRGEDSITWVSPDQSTVYVVSDRAGGLGRDIWVANRAGNGPFAAPTNLAALNSSDSEQGIVLSADELQAFVARSTGVYYTSRASKAAGFSPPTVIAELSAPGAPARPVWVSADGCTLYFDSTRAEAGAGRFHLYRATRAK